MNFANLATSTILLGSIAAAAALVYFPYLVVAVTRFQVGFDIGPLPAPPLTKCQIMANGQLGHIKTHWEAFILYSAAALMAYSTHQDSATVVNCAIGFTVAAPLVFNLLYYQFSDRSLLNVWRRFGGNLHTHVHEYHQPR